MADLDQLKKQTEEAEKAAAEAAEKRNEAVDNYDTARVESMTPELVEEAEGLGINPRNFENDTHLQEAVDRVKSEQPKTEGEEV